MSVLTRAQFPKPEFQKHHCDLLNFPQPSPPSNPLKSTKKMEPELQTLGLKGEALTDLMGLSWLEVDCRVITSSPCVEDVLLGQKKQATLQEEHVTSLASTNSVVANPNAPAFLPRVKIESSSDRPGSSQSENVESKETQQEPPGAEKICENETAFEAKVIDKVSSHPPIGVPKKSASDW